MTKAGRVSGDDLAGVLRGTPEQAMDHAWDIANAINAALDSLELLAISAERMALLVEQITVMAEQTAGGIHEDE